MSGNRWRSRGRPAAPPGASAAFTAVELAICLSLAAAIVPIVYTFASHVEDQSALGHWRLDAADGVRTLSEELALDARRGTPLEGPDVGFVVDGCEVRYRVTEGSALVRDPGVPCGGPRGLARYVESLTWSTGGVDVVFARRMRAARVHRITVFVPVEGR